MNSAITQIHSARRPSATPAMTVQCGGGNGNGSGGDPQAIAHWQDAHEACLVHVEQRAWIAALSGAARAVIDADRERAHSLLALRAFLCDRWRRHAAADAQRVSAGGSADAHGQQRAHAPRLDASAARELARATSATAARAWDWLNALSLAASDHLRSGADSARVDADRLLDLFEYVNDVMYSDSVAARDESGAAIESLGGVL